MGIKPNNDGTTSLITNNFLTDLFSRRGQHNGGFNNIRVVELDGGKIIEPTAFEPNANTYRGEYYYNAITNALYRKIITRKEPGIVVAHWQKISD